MMATLFPPTRPEEVELHLPARRDVWLRAIAGVRVRTKTVERPRDPERRLRCKRNLPLFAETYFPDVYFEPQDYHIETLIRLQDEILMREPMVFKSCDAAPRGIGRK